MEAMLQVEIFIIDIILLPVVLRVGLLQLE